MFRYIRAMAESDSEIRRRLSDKAEVLDEHLIKVILYSRCQEYGHWRSEIYGFLNRVDKRKTTKKYPSEKFIFEAISCHNDILDNIIYQVKSYMNEEPSKISDREISRRIEEYQKWLASCLAETGRVTPSEVYDALDSLGI